MERQVVITGMGCVTPLGNHVNEFYRSLKQELEQGDHQLQPNLKPRRIKNFDFYNKELLQEQLRLDMGCRYLLESVRQALETAGLNVPDLSERTDVGVIIGSSYGLFVSQGKYLSSFYKTKKASSILFMQTANNLLSGIVAYQYKIKGFNTTIYNGWTSGLDAVMIAARLISSGSAEIIIAGGVDILNETMIEYLNNTGSGIAPGEGAGILILQSQESALKNNIKIRGNLIESNQTSFYDEADLAAELANLLETHQALDFYLANQNHSEFDSAEKELLKKFNLLPRALFLKPIIGECGAATGIMQLIFALNLHQKSSLVTNIGQSRRLSWGVVQSQ